MASDEDRLMEGIFAEFVADRGNVDPHLTPLGVERKAFKVALNKYSAVVLGQLLLKFGMSPKEIAAIALKKQ